MENFYELSSDTIDKFNEIINKKAIPCPIKLEFLGNSKQKGLIKITKIADQFSFLLNKDLLVSFNEDLFDKFDDESKTILIEQEIDKININIDSGKIKLVGTDLNTFSALVSKYGVEKVSRANQIEILSIEQKEDIDDEFIA